MPGTAKKEPKMSVRTPGTLQIIAQRGISRQAPENTVAAFVKCLELRIDWFHAEVRSLADGSLVVMGDPTVDRTTNGQGQVAKLDFSAVRRLDAGIGFDPKFRFERVPELATVIELANATPLSVSLELKDESRDSLSVAVRGLAQLKDASKALISSYRPTSLAFLQRECPQIPRGLRVSRGRLHSDLSSVLAEAVAVDCHVIFAEEHALSSESIATVTEAGFQVIAWTVDSVERARELATWGVTGVVSQNPEKIRDAGL